MTVWAPVLAFVAGVLSILSPCVLPILPIVLGAAASRRRFGPAALVAGLIISFVGVGLFVATAGYSLGLNSDFFRNVAAVAMIGVGAVLLVPCIEARLALAGAPVANWSDRHLGTAAQGGIVGQALVGLILGAMWSPCVGPTLGAASVLAARGRDLGEVAITMLAFGLGAGIPLAAIGLLSRDVLSRWRAHLVAGGTRAKSAFAILLIAIGLLVLTGLDKRVEALAVDRSPQWLIDLTTRF